MLRTANRLPASLVKDERDPDLRWLKLAIFIERPAGNVALVLSATFFLDNHEGDLVTWIQDAGRAGEPVILNAGAYSHTSIAIFDAIKGSNAHVIEVHLSNIHAREHFRHHSRLSAAARGVIVGFGSRSYDLALQALLFAPTTGES